MGEASFNNSKELYNKEPVFYCKDCLSLKIRTVAEGSDLDFCDHCGSTNIALTNIEDWLELYRKRYGFDFLTKNIINDGRQRN